uniref:Uncharacterized protein n=1 Tax=Myotis myotis TaxID=51298 RepID=A0A7J7T698_MYOMY|nr:hypothetical protein mMyoMyo1_009267 [Myotis myotis]
MLVMTCEQLPSWRGWQDTFYHQCRLSGGISPCSREKPCEGTGELVHSVLTRSGQSGHACGPQHCANHNQPPKCNLTQLLTVLPVNFHFTSERPSWECGFISVGGICHQGPLELQNPGEVTRAGNPSVPQHRLPQWVHSSPTAGELLRTGVLYQSHLPSHSCAYCM